MKQLEIKAAVYDRECSEYIQRMLRVELSDKEAELFAQLKESIEERTGKMFPFKEYGWCDNEEEPFLRDSPLSDVFEDSNGHPHHRFSIVVDLHTLDVEDPKVGCGWINC